METNLVPPQPAPCEVTSPPPRQPGDDIGMVRITKEESTALMVIFPDEDHDIKPTEVGEVFVGQVHVRRRLNAVLGAGQWGLEQIPDAEGRLYMKEGDKDSGQSVLMMGQLYIRGVRASQRHVGEQLMSSARMTYASACEAAQSDTIARCAKDLSVGWECWDRRWCDEWRSKQAIRVAVKRKGEVQYVWRRKDAPPLRGEVLLDRKAEPVAKAETGGTTERLISEDQASDLWALITEQFPRQKAQALAREILKRHGFGGFREITEALFPKILAEIKAVGKET